MKREFGWITEEEAYGGYGYEDIRNIDDCSDLTYCDSFDEAEEQAEEASEDTEGGYAIYEFCDGELVSVHDCTKFDDLYDWEGDKLDWWEFRRKKNAEMTEYFENGPSENNEALIKMGVAKYDEDRRFIGADGDDFDWEQTAEAFVQCVFDDMDDNMKRASEAERVFDELAAENFDEYLNEAASGFYTFEEYKRMYGWADRA